MKTRRLFVGILSLFLVGVPFVGLAGQCGETYVDNATMVVPSDATSDSFDKKVTATTKTNGVCAGEIQGTSSSFALAIRGNDTVVNTGSVDGAVPGESFTLQAGEKSVGMRLESSDLPIQKTKTEYEDGAVYVASSFEALAVDSSKIGFETDTLYVSKDSAAVDISVTLPSADTLSGVQFDMPFDGPVPNVTKGYDKGTLQTNQISSDTLRVLLYTTSETDLPKQSTFSVTTEVTPEGQTIGLTNAYASTGGAGNTVEVDLNIGQSPLYVEQASSNLVVQTDSLGYGETVVGSPEEKSITIENQGTADGTVSLSTDNSLFTTTDNTTVPAGASKNVPVTFAPTRAVFGNQSATVSLSLEGSAASVPAGGKGVGGRGDPTLSGTVDVSDVVMTADIILGQVDVSATESEAADVYPVSESGDGTIKISDLQTTVGAVLNEGWPDGAVLPSVMNTSSNSSGLAKTTSAPETGPKVVLRETPKNTTDVYLVSSGETKGLQLQMSEALAKKQAPKKLALRARSYGGGSRVLAFRQDGRALPAGSLHVATAKGRDLEVSQAIQTTLDYNTTALSVTRVEHVEENSLTLYPNPARSKVNVAVSLQEPGKGRVDVVDVLGRTVHSAERRRFGEGQEVLTLNVGNLSSGAYFVRFKGETYTSTTRLTVIR